MAKTDRFPSLADIEKLPPEEQRRLRRGLHPRTVMFSRRFNPADIADWRRAAEKLGKSDTDFFEETMNEASAKILRRK